MDVLLRGLRWQTCLCYLDDVVIFSATFKEHLLRLQSVLECIKTAGLQLNTKKCHLACRHIQILGHTVSADGIRPDPDKIRAVSEFPRPLNIKQLKSFLGLCSYFRRFIQDFADRAAPLNRLLSKDTAFEWTEDQENSFKSLKLSLTNDPILSPFDSRSPTKINASINQSTIQSILYFTHQKLM